MKMEGGRDGEGGAARVPSAGGTFLIKVCFYKDGATVDLYCDLPIVLVYVGFRLPGAKQ